MEEPQEIRVRLTIEGGFAALPMRTFVVDTTRLATPTAAELRHELEDACRQERPDTDLSGAPDVFVYRLDVDGQITVGPLTFDDVTASPELRALVARVQELAAASESLD